jgi:hypothetical protein
VGTDCAAEKKSGRKVVLVKGREVEFTGVRREE